MAAFKAQAMMRDLKSRIQNSVPGAVVFTESLDASSYPILKVVKGSETVFVKIEDKGNAGRVDALGLPQRAYSPHKVNVLRDGDTISDRELREKIFAEAVKCGCDANLYEINTLPGSYDLTGATLIVSIKSDVRYTITQSE